MSSRSPRGSRSQGTTATQPAAAADDAAASPAPPLPGDEDRDQDLADQRARIKSLSARLAKALKLRESIRTRARKLEDDQAEYRRYVQERNSQLVQEARDFRSAEADAQAEMGEIPDLEAAIARIRSEIGEG